MTATEIRALFQRFARMKVGVIGDFALDLYFTWQTQTGERSLETGLDVFWGSAPRASLGAAGNVVQNLVALGVSNIQVIGCVGNDLYGREMLHLFKGLGVNTQHLRVVSANWDTCVYTKPNQYGLEANRIDFGTGNTLSNVLYAEMLDNLERTLDDLDVLIVNQQFANPLLNKNRVARINDLIVRFPKVRFVADMRQVGTQIRGATLKVNTAELADFLSVDCPQQPDLDWCTLQGRVFQKRSGGPLVITRGPAGILYVDQQQTQSVDSLTLPGELDTVGAGDTVVATWAACIGAGATARQALEVANLAAAVTVQKLAQTGTASLTEILDLHEPLYTND